MRFEVRERAGLFPSLLVAWRSFERTRRFAAWPDTELVIEGFPRSANTFACLAFELAQGRTASLGHHLHVPAQILYAARHGIPTLVLIRPPAEAVAAAKLVMPFLSVEQLVRAYIRFYGRILPYRKHFVVGAFEDVSERFGVVIRSVNERFQREFRLFVHSAANQQKCFDQIERQQRLISGDADLEFTAARPSPQKARLKDLIRVEIEAPRLRSLLLRAMMLHDAIRGKAPEAKKAGPEARSAGEEERGAGVVSEAAEGIR